MTAVRPWHSGRAASLRPEEVHNAWASCIKALYGRLAQSGAASIPQLPRQCLHAPWSARAPGENLGQY